MSGELMGNAVLSVLEMFRFWNIFEIIIESFALRMERRTAIVFWVLRTSNGLADSNYFNGFQVRGSLILELPVGTGSEISIFRLSAFKFTFYQFVGYLWIHFGIMFNLKSIQNDVKNLINKGSNNTLIFIDFWSMFLFHLGFHVHEGS